MRFLAVKQFVILEECIILKDILISRILRIVARYLFVNISSSLQLTADVIESFKKGKPRILFILPYVSPSSSFSKEEEISSCCFRD